MKKIILILISILIFINLSGCNNNLISNSEIESVVESVNSNTNAQNQINIKNSFQQKQINLYFPKKNNEKIEKETRNIIIKDNAIIKATIEALLKGTQNGSLKNSIPKNTKIISINKKDDVAILNFSNEFKNVGDIEEIVEIISIVNTVTEIQGINGVKILVDDEELIAPSGEPYGIMHKYKID